MRVIWEDVRTAWGVEVCLGGAAAMAQELWVVVEDLAFVVAGGLAGLVHGRKAVPGEEQVERVAPSFAGFGGEMEVVLAGGRKGTAHLELAECDIVARSGVAFAEQRFVPTEPKEAGLAR